MMSATQHIYEDNNVVVMDDVVCLIGIARVTEYNMHGSDEAERTRSVANSITNI